MKGLVFTEFFDMVESVFDADMVDTLIDETNPSSEGAYTAVGSYDYQELEDMVVELAKQTGSEVSDLLLAFGKHLGAQFASRYTHFFTEAGDTLSLLKQIDQHIHVEVRKLYPDAELPEFSFEERPEQGLFELHYSSIRPLADLAYGLILQSSQFYNEQFDISMKRWSEGETNHCLFTLKTG
jgi:hypothetical protein